MKKKSTILAAVILVLVVIAAGLLYMKFKPGTTAGEKEVEVTIAHLDGNETTFTYDTDAEYLGELLLDVELVEGEEASPDYFGLDTGDASKDDALNQDEIGENELLVVSFGTSYNDSRVEDIKGIEDALKEAYPDWSVRRAFTAQIIINHVQARDGEVIDNMEQALDRAVENLSLIHI